MAKLGDICKFQSGGTPSKANESFFGGSIPWITTVSLNDSVINEENAVDWITESAIKQSAAKIVPKNSVMIGTRVGVGKTAINSVEMSTSQDVISLLDIDEDKWDKHFLCLFFVSKRDYLLSQARGATIKGIKIDTLSSLDLPEYSLSTQKQIAANLDKVTQTIDLCNAILEKLDLLVKARFVEMFGDTGKQVLLSDYVWFQEGPGVRSVDFTENGTILLTGSNINNNTISFGYKSDRFISNELATGRYAHFICDKDDILVVSSAIDPNRFDEKVVIVQEDKKYCLNTGIIRFKPNRKFLTLGYFREFLKTDYFKHQVIEEMRGIAQMHFGPSHLKKMNILLPESLEMQELFENYVAQTDKSKAAVKALLKKAETLKKALMQEYFG